MIDFFFEKTVFAGGAPTTLRFEGGIDEGEAVAVFGPSGAGKSTFLRLLAGLDRPDCGRLVVHGVTWSDSEFRFHLPAHRRRVGFVFQDLALFPNLDVRANIAYGAPRDGDTRWVDSVIEATGLTAYARRMPAQLSGGQAQRVALARAAACRPRLLLLDEPMSSLDLELRWQLQGVLARLHEEIGCTTILVSHDLTDIARLAGRVFQLREGRFHTHPSLAHLLDANPPLATLAGDLAARLALASSALHTAPQTVHR